ncbi:DUF4403 family protein [Polaribacter gangjinensis]|uniref:DUF4403 domain-containing protein n=1 Tax=Polaribacter gangjinensis TaxID=574710 RepID=A0A2S7W9Z4_9FLAO|nr:DUF4403 family protein [Polaribacter gangjinensis]PQJ74454.1 hypothetical protein BTO13_03850 [Polaribacter gangjinensis]
MKIVKNLFLSSITLFLVLMLYNCGSTNKIEALKPYPSNNDPIAYKSTTSTISMPMEITLKEIENQLNKSLNGLIYEDTNAKDDQTEMKIWKTGVIQLTEKNGKIQSVIPLKISVKYTYGAEFMGLTDTREILLSGKITLSSSVKLSNWMMKTNSKIEGIQWNETPSVLVAGKKVPITYIINPTLTIFKGTIAQKIDEAISQSCNFKPYVLDVLETMSLPIKTSPEYETWFKIVPIEVYVTDAVLQKNKVVMDLGLKCNMVTHVGQEPEKSIDKAAISFKPVAKIPTQTNASIAAISTYENASRIITKNFQGKEFSSGSRKITVQKVDLWLKDGKMIFALNMAGSVNGTLYLSGIPNYNTITKEIYFDQLDYVLNSKGILTKTANWLLQGTILKKIQENCRYSVQDNLDEAKKSMLPYLNNFSPMKGVFINGSLDDFYFEKVELTDKAIIAFIKGSGKMKIFIDGME